MIFSIESSLANFKSLSFRPGLNILLADTKDKDASRKTRNSAGKTSFLLIVDFLLGANCEKESLFRSDALINEFFRGKFAFGNRVVEVERSGGEPSRIYVLSGTDSFGKELREDSSKSRKFVSLADWKRVLGHQYFELPLNLDESDFDEKYGPTYRALVKYFLRLNIDGGFQDPNKCSASQQPYSWQACLSYLFGLEWRIARSFQEVREKEKTLNTLKRVASGGVLGKVVGSVAKLRPEMVIAEQRASEKRDEIANFQVLESYKDLTENAAVLQRSMQEASRNLVLLKETLKFLQEAIESEKPASQMDVRSMYEASGIELPEVALRRFKEVELFQASIVENRRLHLQTEFEQTEREIAKVQEQLSSSGESRKHILTSLEGKGAFEDLVEMQRELAHLETVYANLKERYTAAEALESDKAELDVDRIELKRRLQADHTTHSEKINRVILRIAELIASLYENREGYFEVSATDNGPDFDIKIAGDRGTGIRNMEVFCMDVALFESTANLGRGTGFLIHDSHLFDGVDARQIATAISIGKEMTGKQKQYIVTLNSDVFESLSFAEELEIEKYVLGTRLSDDGETSGLFGKRFD